VTSASQAEDRFSKHVQCKLSAFASTMPSIVGTLAGQTQSLLGCFEYSPSSRAIDASITTQPAATAHLCTFRRKAAGKGRIKKANMPGWKGELLLHSQMGEGSHENVRRTAVRMASAATSSPQVGQEAAPMVPKVSKHSRRL
jgi:hypothetical protein